MSRAFAIGLFWGVLLGLPLASLLLSEAEFNSTRTQLVGIKYALLAICAAILAGREKP